MTAPFGAPAALSGAIKRHSQAFPVLSIAFKTTASYSKNRERCKYSPTSIRC